MKDMRNFKVSFRHLPTCLESYRTDPPPHFRLRGIKLSPKSRGLGNLPDTPLYPDSPLYVPLLNPVSDVDSCDGDPPEPGLHSHVTGGLPEESSPLGSGASTKGGDPVQHLNLQ